MVMHNDTATSSEPQYWVTATVNEPKYETEWKFIETEQAFVERKLAQRRPLKKLAVPTLGIFSRKDWQHYHRELESYGHKLAKYQAEVAAGVLPVKFSVYNRAATEDRHIKVELTVTDGRVDKMKKAPERPGRLDKRDKPWALKLPKLVGFSRNHIKITAHGVGAELSALGAHDGAMLVNQLLHIHCRPDTEVSYELTSRNVLREAGSVEISD
jgi:hypothetical protein